MGRREVQQRLPPKYEQMMGRMEECAADRQDEEI